MVSATAMHHRLTSQVHPEPTGGEEEEEENNSTISKLVAVITGLYEAISKLPSLHPSPQVNSLFSALVTACIPSYPSLSLSSLPSAALAMRGHLISLCSSAESLLELHPCSGPLPLSSIVLASRHFPSSSFHNYDIDPKATSLAEALVSNDRSLAERMEFITADAAAIGEQLQSYGVVFLAALVGMGREQKAAVVEHLARHMAPGAMLVVRSAHGARMFLYPVVEPGDLKGFEVLSVYHPDDEVINSVIIARKIGAEAGGGVGSGGGAAAANCKCCEAKMMKNGHGGVVVEELPTGA